MAKPKRAAEPDEDELKTPNHLESVEELPLLLMGRKNRLPLPQLLCLL